MKKLGLVLAAAFVVAGASAASAAPTYCGASGCVGVAADGYIIVADGNPSNPDPGDGFVGVTDGGSIDCDSEGGPYTAGTPTDAGCNP